MTETCTADTRADPRVSDLLCFNLFAAARAVTSLYRPVLDRAGITYPQFLVLALLWEQDQRPIRELVQELGLDYSTLSPLVRRLENNGFLRRRNRPGDKRWVHVELTGEGRALRWIVTALTEKLRAALEMDDEELVVLRSALQRLQHNASH
ncbi:MarR family winged helix-turn-helix transcriptional regulator [Lentzea jiangxiensis]|uniref:DNA-binding transcriptional regulator, MarR family n=1 Tax=Lentzea jiangxiensis TaxID=641025 RepID=A0A1H0SKH3_9PSEU|nr:MarR family transcriptional regulator [Lentzea jiangxiensis]SDP42244.1 DNA-binding transcriptional regulator, MarR family [Lentzea jiangxiensis]